MADLAARHHARLIAVVSDHHVAALYGRPLARRLGGAGLRAALLSFRAGEASKTRETKARLEDALAAIGAGRDTVVVALGGGVTGDLAGYVAATWHRGVPVLQAPTSLLAMADSALGGKTAVDLPAGKNLVGAFHQPEAVYADLDLLSTLPDREYRAGFAEVVKCAAIGDRRLFGRLERDAPRLRRRIGAPLEGALAACLALKARVVAGDPHESGRRAVLNFGHTIAHALEAASSFRMRHGEALAVGLAAEARLAVRWTGFPDVDAARIEALLRALGLRTSFPPRLRIDSVIASARRDKKSRGGDLRFALPIRLGVMPPGSGVTLAVPEASVREALASLV